MKGLARQLTRWMAHPLARHIELDAARTIGIHKRIVESKALLTEVYRRFYAECLPAVSATADLPFPMIELGCGPSHIERYIPGVLKTDLVAHENVSRVVDAQSLPFADGGVRAVFLIDVLHHVEQPSRCLKEIERCLAVRGRAVLVEPSDSLLTKFMITHLHPSEVWNEDAPTWANAPGGRLSAANNAIPFLIFKRDRELFERHFPRLRIRRLERHTLFAYYLSGGLSYRSLVPAALVPAVAALGKLARPISRRLGMMMTIELEKI